MINAIYTAFVILYDNLLFKDELVSGNRIIGINASNSASDNKLLYKIIIVIADYE